MRDAIGKQAGRIHPEDVIDLTELDARGKGIESLEGIQHLQSLEILDLGKLSLVRHDILATTQ